MSSDIYLTSYCVFMVSEIKYGDIALTLTMLGKKWAGDIWNIIHIFSRK